MKTPKLGVVEEFRAFLLKHGVVGLAVGVVIGASVGKVVKALVDDFIMPVVGFLTPSGDWRAITVNIWKIRFGVGDFTGNLIDFTIVAFVVFIIVKALIKDEPKVPEPPSKKCPACAESILAEAKRCKYCTSELK